MITPPSAFARRRIVADSPVLKSRLPSRATTSKSPLARSASCPSSSTRRPTNGSIAAIPPMPYAPLTKVSGSRAPLPFTYRAVGETIRSALIVCSTHSSTVRRKLPIIKGRPPVATKGLQAGSGPAKELGRQTGDAEDEADKREIAEEGSAGDRTGAREHERGDQEQQTKQEGERRAANPCSFEGAQVHRLLRADPACRVGRRQGGGQRARSPQAHRQPQKSGCHLDPLYSEIGVEG